MAPTQLSEIEQQRLKFIAERDKLLKDLQIQNRDIIAKTSSPKPDPSKKRKAIIKKEKPKDEAPASRRTSARIAGIPAESEVAKRKAEEQAEAVAASDRRKRQRLSGNMSLQDVFVSGSAINTNIFDDVAQEPTNVLVKSDEGKVKGLRETMEALSLYEQWEPNRKRI